MRLPDPDEVTTVGRFLDLLRDLRQWAGQPSLRRLRQLAGTTIDTAGRRVDALPASTVSDVLRRGHLPRMEFVRGFVTACLRARELGPDRVCTELERWHRAWSALAAAQSAGHDTADQDTSRPGAVRQLPAAAAEFTGRDHELGVIDSRFTAAAADGVVPVVAIAGAGGVGKSALAIHAAHRLAERFPDGQLYVDLRGATAGLPPLGVEQVLGRFLRALGASGSAVEGDVDEMAARFRSTIAGRRLLLVLDDAADTDQVAPILPGTAGCGVLLTSRHTLGRLHCAGQIRLDVLSSTAAVGLLGSLAGAGRVTAEPDAARRVAGACGHLPLALRIAGARLAARPGWSLAHLADRLADQRRLLDELEDSDAGVRASFGVSYRQLHDGDGTDSAAATLFMLLGLWDGPDLTTPLAARLGDRPEPATARLLDRLVDTGLLEATGPERYRPHDLLRAYARDRALAHRAEPERIAAVHRALRYHTATAWHASSRIAVDGTARARRADPHWACGGIEFAAGEPAMAWLDAEWANLLAAARQAAAVEPVQRAAVQLAHALFRFVYLRGQWDDWLTLHDTALPVAERTGDAAGLALLHSDHGAYHIMHGRYAAARECLHTSLRLWQRLDDREGQVTVLTQLGITLGLARQPEGVALLEQGLAMRRQLGDADGEAQTLINLVESNLGLGRHERALDHATNAIAVSELAGNRHCQMRALASLAVVHLHRGAVADAEAAQRRSQELNQLLDDRATHAENLDTLGLIHHRTGRFAEALDCFRQSLRILGDLDDRFHRAQVLSHAGATHNALGQRGEGLAAWHEALDIYEDMHLPNAEDIRELLARHPSGAAPPPDSAAGGLLGAEPGHHRDQPVT